MVTTYLDCVATLFYSMDMLIDAGIITALVLNTTMVYRYKRACAQLDSFMDQSLTYNSSQEHMTLDIGMDLRVDIGMDCFKLGDVNRGHGMERFYCLECDQVGDQKRCSHCGSTNTDVADDKPLVEYVYRTRKSQCGYAAIVGRVEDNIRELHVSYQSGFRCRHKAYRYAKHMAMCLNRNHAYLN